MVALAGLALLAAGCGAGDRSADQGSVDVDAPTSGSVAPGTTIPESTAEPRPGGLTELAGAVAAQLADHAAERGSPPPTDAPEEWLVTIEVDLPLTETELDAPTEALPAPFDQLAPVLQSITVRATSPQGMIRHRLDAPFTGLRVELDGSTQVVTTEPGDDPPPTVTWEIQHPRITQLRLTTLAFDGVDSGPEIIAEVGAERQVCGLPGGWTAIALADVRAGVTATLPPLTGTTLPMPSDGSTDPDS